jgi:hypothetical protein
MPLKYNLASVLSPKVHQNRKKPIGCVGGLRYLDLYLVRISDKGFKVKNLYQQQVSGDESYMHSLLHPLRKFPSQHFQCSITFLKHLHGTWIKKSVP